MEAGLANTLESTRDAVFAATLDRVWAAHPFYRARFAGLGLRREDVRGVRDLPRLPVTRKAEFVAQPDAFRLGSDGAPADERTTVWDTMYTTGSTGAPTPFVSTAYDFPNILALQAGMMRLRGAGPDDSVLNLFPLTPVPHGAFIRALHACAAVGIPVTAPLPGRANERRPELGQRLDEVVATAARVRPTILWGVPSYIRRFLSRAEELGATLPTVRLVFVTGEGFGESARAALLDQLRRLGAPAPAVSVSYGATEMQGGMVECVAGAGYHNPAPDQFFLEAVDPGTLEPVVDGAEGLLLLTHLDRRGTVLLRYALGDVARLTRQPCPHCGALGERLMSVPRRVDGLVKIRGMLVDPAVMNDALAAEEGVAQHQAVVEPEQPGDPLSTDRLVLKVVPAGDVPGLAARLAEAVQRAVGVTPAVELTTADDPVLAGRGWKARPLVDLRPPRA